MKHARNVYYSLAVCVLGLFSAATTFGAEEGGSPAERSAEMIFKWIHFAILAGFLYWVFGKLLPPMFRRNADNINSAITKATAAKVEAEQAAGSRNENGQPGAGDCGVSRSGAARRGGGSGTFARGDGSGRGENSRGGQGGD